MVVLVSARNVRVNAQKATTSGMPLRFERAVPHGIRQRVSRYVNELDCYDSRGRTSTISATRRNAKESETIDWLMSESATKERSPQYLRM
jgi:hypothetical protein